MGKRLDTIYDLVHFVIHSHIDHTWWNPPEVCRNRNREILNQALELAGSDKDFKFSCETTSPLIPFLEENPGRKNELRELLQSGRLDVGGLFVAANADVCTEETLARNFYFGRRWLEKELGYSPAVAKECDIPGHTLQMPQMVKDAGMRVLLISRGPRGVFRWVGPDGSEILVYCVPYNWSYWRRLGVSFEETVKNLPSELKRAEERFPGRSLCIPDGDDMTLPNEGLTEIVRSWNQQYRRPVLAVSTFEECLSRVRPRGLPKRSGDIPNLWAVVHALQAETTRNLRTLQNLLCSTEMLCSILCVQKGEFKGYPQAELDSCWRRSLLAADHNWGGKDMDRGGAESDEYKKNLVLESLRDCQKVAEQGFYDLGKKVLSQQNPVGMPIVVFNPMAFDRTDIVSAEIRCDIAGLQGVEVVDCDERPVLFDLDIKESHPDQSIHRACVDMLCNGLPGAGYSVFYVKPLLAKPESQQLVQMEGRGIENEFYRVEFAEDGSRIQSLYDKELDIELAGNFGVGLGPFEFEFGLFELFGIGLRLTVPNQSFFENPENEGSGESVEFTGEIWRAADHPAGIRIERRGSLAQSVIAEGDFVDSRRRQRVVLYNGLKRVDLHVELEWAGKSDTVVYLQMPNSLMDGQTFLDVPFGVHKMGNELADYWINEEFPVKFKARGIQDWMCFEKDGNGVAIATRWPVADFTTVPGFPLLWTNDNSGFFFGERYRQAGGQSYSFSLTSYRGSWHENNVHRWGRQWSKRVLAFLGDMAAAEPHHSFLSIEPNNIVLSAMKKAEDEDAVVMRLYEIAGRKTEARVRTSFPVKRARISNLIESAAKRLGTQRDTVFIPFRPFEIKTIKLYA